MSSANQEFLRRLEEITADLGSKAALARKADIPPTTLQIYFDGSEPSRATLVALADAASVNIQWLAAGRGEKRAGDAPSGYLSVGCYDLTETGPFLRGMVGNPGSRRLIRQDDLLRANHAGRVFAVDGCEGLAFLPEINEADLLVIAMPPGERDPLRPSAIEAWRLVPDTIYLVAEGADLKLRKLQPGRDSSIAVVAPGGKRERTLRRTPRDFIVFGPVVWRSGLTPRGRPS